MVASLASAEAEAALWIRGDHACMGQRWLLPGPLLRAMWLSFAPGLRISMVTHNKPGSTAQRERQDFYPDILSLKTSALPCFHCVSAESCSWRYLRASPGWAHKVPCTGSLFPCAGSPGGATSWGRPCVAIRCWVTGCHQGI